MRKTLPSSRLTGCPLKRTAGNWDLKININLGPRIRGRIPATYPHAWRRWDTAISKGSHKEKKRDKILTASLRLRQLPTRMLTIVSRRKWTSTFACKIPKKMPNKKIVSNYPESKKMEKTRDITSSYPQSLSQWQRRLLKVCIRQLKVHRRLMSHMKREKSHKKMKKEKIKTWSREKSLRQCKFSDIISRIDRTIVNWSYSQAVAAN